VAIAKLLWPLVCICISVLIFTVKYKSISSIGISVRKEGAWLSGSAPKLTESNHIINTAWPNSWANARSNLWGNNWLEGAERGGRCVRGTRRPLRPLRTYTDVCRPPGSFVYISGGRQQRRAICRHATTRLCMTNDELHWLNYISRQLMHLTITWQQTQHAEQKLCPAIIVRDYRRLLWCCPRGQSRGLNAPRGQKSMSRSWKKNLVLDSVLKKKS